MAFGDQDVVADLEAGIGTLTRLPPGALDTVLVAVEPTGKSLEVGRRAVDLAARRAVPTVLVLARVTGAPDLDRVRAELAGCSVLGVPEDPAIVAAERAGTAPLDSAPDAPAVRALSRLVDRLTGGAPATIRPGG